MVLRAADGVDNDFEVVANACGIGPEARLKFRGDGFAAIFGAEDNVQQVLGVCVGHVACVRRKRPLYIMYITYCKPYVAPTALAIVLLSLPGLTPWANVFRASGASEAERYLNQRIMGLTEVSGQGDFWRGHPHFDVHSSCRRERAPDSLHTLK